MSQPPELHPLLVQPLHRPEPKPVRRRSRKARRGARARPQVMRVAIGIVVVTAGLSFAGRIGALALAPVAATYRTGWEIKRLKGDFVRQAAMNAHLREDIAYLGTPAGIEQEARRRGWVKPGEVALTVVKPEGDSGRAAKTKRGGAAGGTSSWSDRIQEAVDTCLTVLGSPKKPK